MQEDYWHSTMIIQGRYVNVITGPDISRYEGERMDDKACRVCGRTDLHSHNDNEIEAYQQELNRSISRHPAGRKIAKT